MVRRIGIELEAFSRPWLLVSRRFIRREAVRGVHAILVSRRCRHYNSSSCQSARLIISSFRNASRVMVLSSSRRSTFAKVDGGAVSLRRVDALPAIVEVLQGGPARTSRWCTALLDTCFDAAEFTTGWRVLGSSFLVQIFI